MKFLVIFGPAAVGKMTVGYELAKLTGLKLFHNHMTIDLVLNFFNFGEPAFNRLISDFRFKIFEEVATSKLPGLIFTFVWGLELESDKEFIDQSTSIFQQKGGEVYYIELEADLSERLRRNETDFRLEHKRPKRDIEKSRNLLLEHEAKYKMNSQDDFFYLENYIKINNTHLSAYETAQKIIDRFELPIITP